AGCTPSALAQECRVPPASSRRCYLKTEHPVRARVESVDVVSTPIAEKLPRFFRSRTPVLGEHLDLRHNSLNAIRLVMAWWVVIEHAVALGGYRDAPHWIFYDR